MLTPPPDFGLVQRSSNLDLNPKSRPCFQFYHIVSLIITHSDWAQKLHTGLTGKRRLENQCPPQT